jgi:hypothetical protein
MGFKVLGEIVRVAIIAKGVGVRDRARLQRIYGRGNWRKLKGIARVQLDNGHVRLAELHWYEAHGIGRKEIKRKRYLD